MLSPYFPGEVSRTHGGDPAFSSGKSWCQRSDRRDGIPGGVMSQRIFVRLVFTLLALAVLLPGSAHAQSAIAGVVRDTSGAVMPGVTVEATSPALIEKVR